MTGHALSTRERLVDHALSHLLLKVFVAAQAEAFRRTGGQMRETRSVRRVTVGALAFGEWTVLYRQCLIELDVAVARKTELVTGSLEKVVSVRGMSTVTTGALTGGEGGMLAAERPLALAVVVTSRTDFIHGAGKRDAIIRSDTVTAVAGVLGERRMRICPDQFRRGRDMWIVTIDAVGCGEIIPAMFAAENLINCVTGAAHFGRTVFDKRRVI